MIITADILKPGQEALPSIALNFGILLAAINIPTFIAPEKFSRIWSTFPRNIWAGRILAAISLIWAGVWLNVMAIGFLTPIKQWLIILVPISIVVVSYGIPDLLACRALGGVMVLLPCPLLSAAQWHPSEWRYLIIILAYIVASLGMVAIALPYQLRDMIFFMVKSKQQLRFFAALGTLAAVILILLSATALQPDSDFDSHINDMENFSSMLETEE